MPIDPDDVCLNKAAIIERTIRRMFEEFQADPPLENFTHIDALTLNIERACQAAIDLAMHLVAREHLGMPQTGADAFRLLLGGKLITPQTARDMVAMTGFRNIAIHQYRELDLSVLRAIVTDRWKSFVAFCGELGLDIRPCPQET